MSGRASAAIKSVKTVPLLGVTTCGLLAGPPTRPMMGQTTSSETAPGIGATDSGAGAALTAGHASDATEWPRSPLMAVLVGIGPGLDGELVPHPTNAADATQDAIKSIRRTTVTSR